MKGVVFMSELDYQEKRWKIRLNYSNYLIRRSMVEYD